MTNYHARMMNIQPPEFRFVQPIDYHEGHRDARHAAAEIALEADIEIADKDAEIARLKRMAYRLKSEHEKTCDCVWCVPF